MLIDWPVRALWGAEWAQAESPEPLGDRLRSVGQEPLRRSNRLMTLAQLGAAACVQSAGASPERGTGLVLGARYANLAETARLARVVLDDGMPPMPFDFINVSTNLAGFQVAQCLGMEGGPNLMVAHEQHAMLAALEVATLEPERPWLVGGVEEGVWPLAEHRRRLGVGDDASLAEATYWLWLEPGPAGGGRRIRSLSWCLGSEVLAERCREAVAEAAGGVWVATPLQQQLGELLPADLLELVLPWTAAEAGWHPVTIGRLVCRFLDEGADEQQRLLIITRDPVGGHYALLVIDRGNAAPRP